MSSPKDKTICIDSLFKISNDIYKGGSFFLHGFLLAWRQLSACLQIPLALAQIGTFEDGQGETLTTLCCLELAQPMPMSAKFNASIINTLYNSLSIIPAPGEL